MPSSLVHQNGSNSGLVVLSLQANHVQVNNRMELKYCAAPWRGLHINFRGDVKTCCAGDPNMLGDLNHHSIEEILHGPLLAKIRDTIKSGVLHPVYCSNCIKAERYGRSERHWHNDVSKDFDISQADLDEHKPAIVDVRWNITCNLACNYCGPYCSSKWAAMMKFEYKSGARPYYEQVCDYILKHRDSVKEVALVGGEPLLLPENERLLDVIPDDCIVTLITNMNVDFSKNSIVKKLEQRTKVGWSMSFDNIQDRFEYVRYHGAWPLLVENVRRVKSYFQEKQHYGGIHAVYNLYNCTRLCELREWADQEGIKIHWQTLYQPECLDVGLHNEKIRTAALDEISNYYNKFDVANDERDFFNAVKERLSSATEDPSALKSLTQHIKDVEHKYHKTSDPKKFADLWPELANLI